jgi:hypothetical protein
MTMVIDTLRTKTQPLSVAQCAEIMGITTDALRSVIWARNFPMSAVGGYGEQTRIAPQVLVREFEARQQKSVPSGESNLDINCP